MMKYSYPMVLGFLGLFFLPFWALGQDAENREHDQPAWSLFAEWLSYSSFSQQNSDVPMKAGYPVIQANMPALGVCFNLPVQKAHHHFKLSFGLPSGLDSDDGTGKNRLLRDNLMNYYRAGLDYRLTFPLFHWKELRISHGGASGFLYEYRNLHYLSGARESARDINWYLGPALNLDYRLNEQWSVQGGFDARFYLPYLNSGTLVAIDPQGRTVFSEEYRGFYYQTVFVLEAAFRLPSQGRLKAGIRKNDMVGFAGRNPSFGVDDIVHFKLDRIYHYYIEYQF